MARATIHAPTTRRPPRQEARRHELRAGRRGPVVWLALGALFVVALALRLWALGTMPPGLDTDEASIGYNAFSVLRTGRDEHGARWPLAFEAFGEFKRPAYIYAAVPSIGALGLTPFAVRLPAALAGALAVPAIYAVAALLLRDRQRATLAAALLTVSPWHIQFTRAAREVSLLVLALLLLAAALLGATHARRGEGGALYPAAAVALLLALYSYPGGVIVAPLLSLLIACVYWSRLRLAPRRWVAAAAVLLLLGGLPLVGQFLDGRARARYGAVSIFAEPGLVLVSAQRLARDRQDGVFTLLDRPELLGAWRAAGAYLSHFDPSFLFTRGDPEWRHHSSNGGQLYLWDLPVLVLGLVVAVRHRRRPPMRVLLGWLAIGPLPAAFATESPHAVRSIAMLPACYLVAAVGAVPAWRWLVRRRLQWDWVLALLLSVGIYLFGYYRHYAVEHEDAWSSGWLETFGQAQALVDSGGYARVVIPEDLPGPRVGYIYALFATAYDPERYLAQGGTRGGPRRFAPFEVRDVDWTLEPLAPGALYVFPVPQPLPAGARVVSVVNGVSGRPALRLIALAGGA